MSGERIVATLVESHTAVLRTRGIDLAQDVVEEMARNAAAILHAELQAESPDDDELSRRGIAAQQRAEALRAQLQAEAVPEAIEREEWQGTWSPAP